MLVPWVCGFFRRGSELRCCCFNGPSPFCSPPSVIRCLDLKQIWQLKTTKSRKQKQKPEIRLLGRQAIHKMPSAEWGAGSSPHGGDRFQEVGMRRPAVSSLRENSPSTVRTSRSSAGQYFSPLIVSIFFLRN